MKSHNDEVYQTVKPHNLYNVSFTVQKRNMVNYTFSPEPKLQVLANSIKNAHKKVNEMASITNRTNFDIASIFTTLEHISVWKIIFFGVAFICTIVCVGGTIKLCYFIYCKCLRCKSKRPVNYQS